MTNVRLLSMHGAERRLGVGHGSLAQLAKAGRVRVIPWGKRLKIPITEVERLAREGVPESRRRPRVRRAPAACAFDPAALRALRVEDL